MKCVLGALLVLFLSVSSALADDLPSDEIRSWVKNHASFFVENQVPIVSDKKDVNPEEVLLHGDCKVIANDSGEKGFCGGKGSKYCKVVQYDVEGPVKSYAFNDLKALMISVRQNCTR